MSDVIFYQVGGSVRDALMGLVSKDIDYAVEAVSFDAMRDAILQRGGEIFLETPKFFTIRAKVPTLGACDFVLCRIDGAYADGRHPETVTVGTIYDDLARRDFTMNAIAKREDGRIIDPYHGVGDITAKRIIAVGLPSERFTEDGLRMLRAIRFAITKGFIIDYAIHVLLADETFFLPRLTGVSQERIREELHKCFLHDTLHTLQYLEWYSRLRVYLFHDSGLWLKPTVEQR